VSSGVLRSDSTRVEVSERLWAISIDPDHSLREYLLLQLKVRAMRDLLVRSRIFNYLARRDARAQELSRSERSGSWRNPSDG